MGYTLLGFLIGVAVSWFWLYKLSPARRFQHILSQETGKNSFDEQLQPLFQRMEKLEDRFYRLEDSLINVRAETAGAARGPGPARASARRGQVIRLKEEGCSPEEIIRNTGLAKGEVELILSLGKQREKKEKEG
ncbi:MAG: DUF2802 domain-containing protein [Firmicutes bacterium]|nr:DUF2802 domain-containing protein [Bacillota bacterium]